MGILPMRRSLLPIALLLVSLGALLGACGSMNLGDAETATETKAVETSTQAVALAQPESVEAASTAKAISLEEVPPVDNTAAWSSVSTGVRTFAGRLDQATHNIASCPTDAAAGADFSTCLATAYTAIAAAAQQLVDNIDTTSKSVGACREALATMRAATQAMVDGYQRAVETIELTSIETIKFRLGDDAQIYADATLAAASTCAS